VRVARYLRNYPWPKYSPCPKQINKKERILIINQAPPRKTTAKKKKFEKIQSKTN